MQDQFVQKTCDTKPRKWWLYLLVLSSFLACLTIVVVNKHSNPLQEPIYDMLEVVDWQAENIESYVFLCGKGNFVLRNNESPAKQGDRFVGYIVYPGQKYVTTRIEAAQWLESLEVLDSGLAYVENNGTVVSPPYSKR